MRICVAGAGSIGGYLAVHFADAGHDVTIMARGAHLASDTCLRTGYVMVKLLSHTMSQHQVCVRASPPAVFDAVTQVPETVPPNSPAMIQAA